MINTYTIYIKNHDEGEDYQGRTTAESLDEAAENFIRQAPDEIAGGLDKETIKPFIKKYD